MQKIPAAIIVIALVPIISLSQVKADVNAGADSSRMDLDVSPLISQLESPDPLPQLGIHSLRAMPAGPGREEKIRTAARWLKAAAGRSPVLIEIPDTGYTVHLTGDAQTLQQLKDAVKQLNPPNSPQVVFDCRLFTMSTEAMQKLDERLRKKLLAAMVPGSVNSESITPDECTALMKHCTQKISSPRLILNDGRSGYVLISTDRAYVANVAKVSAKAPATQPSYQPEINLVSSGMAIGAKVNVKSEDKTIAVQVKTNVCNLLEMKTAPADIGDPQAEIQIPTLEMFKFDQLCTIADGESLLCHGEREIINGPTTQPAGDDVFFIITSSIAQPKK